jgi:hypothetical protein
MRDLPVEAKSVGELIDNLSATIVVAAVSHMP